MDYETCLEVVNKLGAVQELRLRDKPITKAVARLMHDYNICELKYLDDLVRSLVTSMSSEGKGTEGSEVGVTPDSLLTEDFLIDLLCPLVREIREMTFGSEDPPFKSYEEALQWIKSQKMTIKDGEGNAVSPEEAWADKWGQRLSYIDEDGKPLSIYPVVGSKLDLLCSTANLFLGVTGGFSLSSAVMYILADIRPHIPRYEITRLIEPIGLILQGGQPATYMKRQAHLTINGELSFDELLSLYEAIKEHLGIKKGKAFKGTHLEIYHMVQQRGGQPKEKGTVMTFWEALRKEWNEKHSDDTYESWKGIKMAYDRIIGKLSSRFQVAPLSEWELSSMLRGDEAVIGKGLDIPPVDEGGDKL